MFSGAHCPELTSLRSKGKWGSCVLEKRTLYCHLIAQQMNEFFLQILLFWPPCTCLFGDQVSVCTNCYGVENARHMHAGISGSLTRRRG